MSASYMRFSGDSIRKPYCPEAQAQYFKLTLLLWRCPFLELNLRTPGPHLGGRGMHGVEDVVEYH